MNVKDAIKERRSIRAYKKEEVPANLINELIDAARLSPSGNNSQPWSFKVITETDVRGYLRKNGIFKQDFVYKAPAIIVCCTNAELYPKTKFDPEYDLSNETRAIRDLSIATQNMVLRATELGLGTCYVGWIKKLKIKEVLNIPSKYLVPFVITVGYPIKKPKPTPRKRMDEILL